jgi:hypothetical protein
MNSVRVRQERDRVLLIKDGQLVLDLPWQTGVELAKALHVKAKVAEEYSQANRIILDQAVLFRAGAPFGLTRHAGMLKESIKEALFNRKLRRYMPYGIKSESVVGTPTVIGGDR